MSAGAWVTVITLAIILILVSLVRRRGGAAKYPEIVQALLYDVRFNQGLTAYFPKLKKPRRFENTNWTMNKDRIGFLGEQLQLNLKEAFTMVEEYNKQIKAAKKKSLIVIRHLISPDLRNYLISAVRNWKTGWFKKPVPKT